MEPQSTQNTQKAAVLPRPGRWATLFAGTFLCVQRVLRFQSLSVAGKRL